MNFTTIDLLGRIEEHAAVRPEQTAVSDGPIALTYAELIARARVIAAQLRELGVEPGQLVGLCAERSASLVAGTLGIALSGAAYVAIDPSYPAERIGWMLDDAAVVAVVTDTPGRGGAERTELVLSRDGVIDPALPAAPAPAVSAVPATDGLAYVVYTSGSTGTPKGVLVEYAGLQNLVDWHCEAFSLTGADHCAQVASPGFDAAVWEIWPALAAGATLHIVPESLRRDPAGLRDWLIAEQITVTFLPTALAEAVISVRWPSEAPLRVLLAGGDALTRRPPHGLPFTLQNNYGLSETTVVATSGPVAPGEGPRPTIGSAIRGVRLEVVEEDGAVAAPGAPGELVIAGVAVARGYLGRPELTAERFSTRDRERRYRTGDRVRITETGEIEFLGRVDDQLSIRGFRVEPGEVVSALTSHPGVAAAAVLADGSQRLVAYAVAQEGSPPPRADLDVHLGASLPEYMLPAAYVWLDALPVTAHGKVDREALAALAIPAPDDAPADGTPAAAEPVADGTTAAVAAIMAELLELDTIAPDANFFMLGGHSMLGAQLIVALDDRFGIEIGLRYLFDNPTPAGVAGEVDRLLELEAQPA